MSKQFKNFVFILSFCFHSQNIHYALAHVLSFSAYRYVYMVKIYRYVVLAMTEFKTCFALAMAKFCHGNIGFCIHKLVYSWAYMWRTNFHGQNN